MSSWWRRGKEALLDLTVPLSFGAPGYRFRRASFDDPELAVDLRGRTMVVTGASAGLGKAAAGMLLARGAKVIAVARSRERLEASAAELRAGVLGTGAELELELADLSLVESTRALGTRLAARGPIDVLVNNAGVLLNDKRVTSEGLETSFATNVLSGFLLTEILSERLAERKGRVVNVTSGGMYFAALDLSELQGLGPVYDGTKAYAQHKRAQVVLSELWAERLASQGIRVDAVHPGWAETPGVKQSLPVFDRLMGPILRSAEEGADSIVYLACAPELDAPSGSLFFDRSARKKNILASTETTREQAEALWELCESLTRQKDA